MLFENNDMDLNMAIFMPDILLGRETKLYEPMEGFLRGNMFKDEYQPYKNLTYFKLNPTCEREKALYKLMALAFAINDLNLYLDLHPSEAKMFDVFKKYIKEYENTCKEYEEAYGPLKITATTGAKYNWLNSPWPWDKMDGGSMYV